MRLSPAQPDLNTVPLCASVSLSCMTVDACGWQMQAARFCSCSKRGCLQPHQWTLVTLLLVSWHLPRLPYEERARLAKCELGQQLFQLMARKQSNLAVAADVPTCAEVLALADKARSQPFCPSRCRQLTNLCQMCLLVAAADAPLLRRPSCSQSR